MARRRPKCGAVGTSRQLQKEWNSRKGYLGVQVQFPSTDGPVRPAFPRYVAWRLSAYEACRQGLEIPTPPWYEMSRQGAPAAAGVQTIAPEGLGRSPDALVQGYANRPKPGLSDVALSLAQKAGLLSPTALLGAVQTALPVFAESIAPVLLPIAAPAVILAALTMGKSEDQLRREAIAAGQADFDQRNADAFNLALTVGPPGSAPFNAVINATAVQNLGETRRTGKFIN